MKTLNNNQTGAAAPKTLRADEVYARISAVNMGGAKALLFMKTAAGERLLDETYGPLGWQFGEDNILRLWNPQANQWVAKANPVLSSAGITETDPFKRGCFRAGIGYDIYNAPEMFIKKNYLEGWEQTTGTDANGRPRFEYKCGDYVKITALDHDPSGMITAIHAEISYKGTLHHKATFTREGATFEAVNRAAAVQAQPAAMPAKPAAAAAAAAPKKEAPTASVSAPTVTDKKQSLFNDNELLLFGNSQLLGKPYKDIKSDPVLLEKWKGLLHWTITANPPYVKNPTEETRAKREQFFKAQKMANEGLY